MPGGLPEVTQRFDADTAGYIAGVQRMIAANRELVDSIHKVQREIRGLPDAKMIRIEVTGVDEAIRKVGELKAALDSLHDKRVGVGVSGGGGDGPGEAMARGYRDAANAAQDAASAEYKLAMAERMRARTAQDAAREAVRASDAAARMAERQARDVERQTRAADVLQRQIVATGLAADRGALSAQRAMASYGDSFAKAGAGFAALRTLGDAAPPIRYADLAAGAAGPPGGGGWDKGTAGSMWAPVGKFLGTWLPRAHYVLMAANELAATLGPAVVAGGMGALVGMQGAEQTIPRLQAVYATAESLGPSLGVSAGKYMGLKAPYLQTAQDLATGASFQAVGAATNILNAGAGNAFIQLGSNTVSMWSRMMANLVQEFQGGMGKQLGDLVTGGTGYLAQFGNIFGNLGHLFMNVAPNLPGVGGDYLSILQGATKGLAGFTGWMGGGMAPVLAFEAGTRIGAPLVGGVGSLLGRAGTGIAGLGDTLAARTGGGLLSRIVGRAGVGVASAGGALGGLGAVDVGSLAAIAMLFGKAATYQTPYQQKAGTIQSAIDQMGFVQALSGMPGTPGLIQAMNQFAAVGGGPMTGRKLGPVGIDAQVRSGWDNWLRGLGGIGGGVGRAKPGEFWHGLVQGTHGILQMGGDLFGLGSADQTPYQVAQQHLQQMSGEFVHILGSGKQVKDLWKSLGGGAVDMGSAFQIATMAQLQLGNAFDKTGHLTKQAKQQVADLYAGYQPMVMNTGQFGAAVGVQTAMAGLQHTQLQAVNQASDQLMQLLTGGATGASGLFGMLGGTPSKITKAGVKWQSNKSLKAMADALTSFTTPGGAAAWNTFANQQSGMMAQLQGQTDWYRTMQTMGALTSGQTTGMTAFQIAQLLPMARKSPAALAMLSAEAQQFGGPAVTAGESAGASFKALSQWVAKHGVSAKGYNQLTTRAIQQASNIPADAQQFVQTTSEQLGSVLAQAVAQHGATLQDAFMSSIGAKGAGRLGYSAGALSKYTGVLQHGGFSLGSAQQIVKFAAQWSGATPQQIAAMLRQVAKTYKATIAVTQAGAQRAQAEISQIKGKPVHIPVSQSGAGAVQAAINAIHGKNVVVSVTYVQRGAPPGAQQFKTATITGSGRYTSTGHVGMQTGGMVPGSGFGDIIPAMLEPGEAIVPRYLVPLVAPILAAHRVPGFGGMPRSASTHFAAGGIVPPAVQVETQMAVQMAAQALIRELEHGMSAADAKKLAQKIVDKISTEVSYAKNVASAAMYGQGYDATGKGSGIFGSMDVSPAGGGTVYQQMQSYLGTVKSFSGDLAKLRKGHLNKDIIAQLVAAGPVQGDALAQSIMNDYGGIGGVNQIWKQLGVASKGLGAQAGMGVYGNMLAPNLKSGTFSYNHVTINISGRGGNTLDLTPKEIKRLVEEIQAKLLQQARRNQKTGLQASGKGA